MARTRYQQSFWPLVTLPLLFGGVAAVVVRHLSATALGALAALAIPVALTEVVVWRALQARWTGAIDSLWPWSSRLRTGLELLVWFAALVALGASKAHDISGGTWTEAVRDSSLTFGGIGAFILTLELVGRHGGNPR